MFKRFRGRAPEIERNIPVSAFVIYKREASWLVAAFLLLSLLSFLAGYFMGQRKAVQAFVRQTSEEALLDQASPEQPQPEQASLEQTQSEQTEQTQSEQSKAKAVKYYAPIAVNDSYGRVIRLVDVAHKHGIELRIKKSSRKLKNGKRKITYQIVTGPYVDKEALKSDLETLKAMPEFKKISINIRQITQKG